MSRNTEGVIISSDLNGGRPDRAPTSDVPVHLRAAGVSLVVDAGPPVPRILHWGADLGEMTHPDLLALQACDEAAVLNNSPDVPRVFTLWPLERDGWSGAPALSGHRDGRSTTPRPQLAAPPAVTARYSGGGSISFQLHDEITGLHLTTRVTLTPEGLVSVRHSLARPAADDGREDAPFDVASVLALLPLPERATEILDFTGKWAREHSPQRQPVTDGAHRRDGRRGKPGPDTPLVLAVGTDGFGNREGEVWAAHIAWSGDTTWLVERLPEGAGTCRAALGGGEGLRPGEIRLFPGGQYVAPEVVFAWSDHGLDGVADRFHADMRAREPHASRPRPLVLNTWEAVYFQQDLTSLLRLAKTAAQVGVERFVLDDGWFTGRLNDTAGLGDWRVDADKWPDGLHPLVNRVRELGMQFGIWFEPEMVNLDSDLARRHPEWLLAPPEGPGFTARNQYPLNLANPEAAAHLLESISRIVSEYGIEFIKWDHNRDLHEAVMRTAQGGVPGVAAQTRALYALLDRLRSRHPGLEIESCSAGGGRIDLGIMRRADRVWASDSNDPVERQAIQRWTALLLPPEVVGAHVGDGRAHTTGRQTDLSFRLITALFGHAGIEWDLTQCTEDELDALARWAALYRELRPLLHTGRSVHADLSDDAVMLHGVVANDGTHGVYAWVRLATSVAGQIGRVRFPGLDVRRRYRIVVREEAGRARRHEMADPAWVTRASSAGIVLPGSVLAITGLPLPTLAPAQAMLFELVAVEE